MDEKLLKELVKMRRALEALARYYRADQLTARRHDKRAMAEEREIQKIRRQERTADWIKPV